MKRILTLIFLAALATGCATTGHQFDDSKVSRIQDGQTTQQQIEHWFGKPDGVTTNSQGQTGYTYSYAEANTSAASFIPVVGSVVGGTNSQAKTLSVWFNKAGVVTQHGFYKSKGHSGF